MRIMIGTNVIIDVLEKRPLFFEDSYGIMHLVAEGTLEGFVPAGSVADIHYILRRAGQGIVETRNALIKLTQVVSLCDTTATDVTAALASSMQDTEDAIIAATAKRIRADYIVTRNERDFANSPVPAITPADLLAQMTADVPNALSQMPS